jgi:LemA protein
MSGLNVAVEAYPELKASDLYKGWMKELAEAESNVAAAIQIFNRNVEDFNNSLQVFPGNMVNGFFNREKPLATFTDPEAEADFEYKPQFTKM